MRPSTFRLAIGILIAVTLSACAMWGCPNCQATPHRSSSLVAFLYPDAKQPPGLPVRPYLHLPLRVGLAFLPSASGIDDATLTAAQKQTILDRVKARFASESFISEIVPIPDYYLTSARGFSGLEGLDRLYNLDLVALISYDQVVHLDDNKLSLAYWTIVGAYVIPGNTHDTTTLMDLAVVDPKTRSLVIRAGGVDTRHGSAALVDLQRKSREANQASFDAAADQMIANFASALTQFEADIKAGRASVQVETASRGGGGALDGLELLVLAAILAASRTRRFRARSDNEVQLP